MKTYESSLKVYRDNYNAFETAKMEGKEEGRWEGILLVAKAMKKEGDPVDKIMRVTGLTEEQIAKL